MAKLPSGSTGRTLTTAVTSAPQTTFPYDFEIADAADLTVTTISSAGVETVKSYPADYSVTGVGTAGGGTIVLGSGLGAGASCRVEGDVTAQRGASFSFEGELRTDVLNREEKRTFWIFQEMLRTLARVFQAPAGFAGSLVLPSPEANTVLGWNGGGTALINVDVDPDGTITADVDANTDAGDGIEKTTPGGVVTFAVDLATDPGLEFDSGDLRAKVTSGVTRTSSGLGADFADETAARAGTSTTKVASPARVKHGIDAFLWPTQCRLVYTSGTTLTLDRHDGAWLVLLDSSSVPTIRPIPSPAPTLSNSGLSADTLYYVYAYWSGSAVTLEASTTAPATNSTTGLQVKNGDASRLLVGMAYTNGSSQFVDTNTTRTVASWFNRRTREGHNYFTADRSTTSTTNVEVNSEIRVGFVSWTGQTVRVDITGRSWNATINEATKTMVAFDGISPTIDGFSAGTSGGFATSNYPAMAVVKLNTLTQGYHYATLVGVASGGTGNWGGGASASFRTTLYLELEI